MPLTPPPSAAGPTAPAGLHHAVCVDVHDLGYQQSNYDGEVRDQPKVLVVWELDPETAGTYNDDGARYRVNRKYTFSYHEKSNLGQDLESWRGKSFSVEERRSFDLESIIGKACQLNIVHKETERGTFANVKAVLPAAKGNTLTPSGDYVRIQDRDQPSNGAAPAKEKREVIDATGEIDFTEDDQLPFDARGPRIRSQHAELAS